jgi:amidase
VSTWLVEWPSVGNAVRVAVKDAIDVAGVPTWAGCAGLRDTAAPATADAACLAGIRAAEARAEVAIVGKTSQTELCLSPTGINKVFGTPVNPLAPDRVPGGSSSGSAVAVANGEADIALGTDTGGSVRIPAACCGIAGLKTTWGRISLAGVWPLAPSLDTVGPLARAVEGVVAGMALLEPGFAPAAAPATTIGRLRVAGVDPAAEDAVDAALARTGFTVHSVELPGWDDSFVAFDTIVLGEFWRACGTLVDNPGVSQSIVSALRRGSEVTDEQLAEAYEAQRGWQAEVLAVLAGVQLLALPTLVGPPPLLTEVREFPITELTAPFNTAGLPALAQPIAATVSLQLVGPLHGEELLCATGLAVEQALS